ncbi:MAG: CPBP family intramembrane metalloprotease [Cyanobacteria bacterium]|nr:CPBP family intramembrane metalloprotease [Cyanobacteriota bacterium]
MSVKRILLIVLSCLAIALIGTSLLASVDRPQIQGRLQLYQTNLLLRASGDLGEALPAPAVTEAEDEDETLIQVRRSLLGQDFFAEALKQYQSVRQQDAAVRDRLITAADRAVFAGQPDEERQLRDQVRGAARSLAELDLRIGILQAHRADLDAARRTWESLEATVAELPEPERSPLTPLANLAADLDALWTDPATPPADLATRSRQLDGWFGDRVLARTYGATGDEAALTDLVRRSRAIADRTLIELAIVNTVPLLGLLVGTGLLISLIVQRIRRGDQAILSFGDRWRWEVPWDGEAIAQVLVLGFFFTGQLVLPLVLPAASQLVLGVPPSALTGPARAAFLLVQYGLLAGIGIAVLIYSIRSFGQLSGDWFRFRLGDRWWLWGLGGYLSALPIVVGISLLNQPLWQGQGGSNPILAIILESNDPWTVACFVITAAIAAPLFEETLFRGFLLPSLTRYMPVWAAITLSAFIFAIAHLSVSEVLPLMALGIVLGVVYTRSRNLLASILLHGLWNGGTLVSLLFLAGSAR